MRKLPGLEDKTYWHVIKWWSENGDPKSDGCSGVKDWYVEACWEHDFHYRYGKTIYGDPITFDEANQRFRESMQMRSKLKRFSPLSWWRWAAVSYVGRIAWEKSRRINRTFPQEIIDELGKVSS
jgi:hypothetical protein